MEIALLLTLIIVALTLNGIASRAIVRDIDTRGAWKIAQWIFVWCLPFLGALVLIAVHRRGGRHPGAYRHEPEEYDGASDWHPSASANDEADV